HARHRFLPAMRRVPEAPVDVSVQSIPCQERRALVPKRSAGLLMYRGAGADLAVLLVHPGGPFWRGKDIGAWSIPKGEIEEGADTLATARREFEEETGSRVDGAFFALKPLKQKSGKLVHGWALQGDIDASSITSNTFSMEWPPRSGKEQEFPEVDRGGWFTIAAAREKILPGQLGFIDQLEEHISS
ncbi:MAG TPA: NUDIX domain-containing protein, partial [Casimicrobiaceae bacterium]|nr:NUDIX domain-containing protein [Casimicrobiaceae bacterium]